MRSLWHAGYLLKGCIAVVHHQFRMHSTTLTAGHDHPLCHTTKQLTLNCISAVVLSSENWLMKRWSSLQWQNVFVLPFAQRNK